MAKKRLWLEVGIGVGVSLAGFFLYRALTAPSAAATPSPDAGTLPSACAQAIRLAKLGHPREGAVWAAQCRAGSPSQAELDALTAAGY